MSDEKPILFSAPMIQAILDGRKCMTRRVIKPQPDESVTGLVQRKTHAGNVLWGNALWVTEKYDRLIELTDRKCPYGKPGDKLWVRETWGIYRKSYSDYCGVWEGDGLVDVPAKSMPQNNRHNEYHVVYRADGYETEEGERWRPSIFMPRWASRITLEVTGVKVERVQDISEEDAKAEGCDAFIRARGLCTENPRDYMLPQNTWRDGFAKLWDSINAKRGYSWDSNPFVWCIAFRRI